MRAKRLKENSGQKSEDSTGLLLLTSDFFLLYTSNTKYSNYDNNL